MSIQLIRADTDGRAERDGDLVETERGIEWRGQLYPWSAIFKVTYAAQ